MFFNVKKTRLIKFCKTYKLFKSHCCISTSTESFHTHELVASQLKIKFLNTGLLLCVLGQDVHLALYHSLISAEKCFQWRIIGEFIERVVWKWMYFMKNPLVSKILEDYFGQGLRCDLKLKEVAVHKLSWKGFWVCLWKMDQKKDREIKYWHRTEDSALCSALIRGHCPQWAPIIVLYILIFPLQYSPSAPLGWHFPSPSLAAASPVHKSCVLFM